jgi:hypothetical protein
MRSGSFLHGQPATQPNRQNLPLQKGIVMPNFDRVPSAPIQYGAVAFLRFGLRVCFGLLLTIFNGLVIYEYAPTLYRAAGHDLFWFSAVTLLFIALLKSLASVWIHMLTRTPTAERAQ